MPKMKAVIIAGGLGKRLRPITDGMPKPLVPIGGTPCIVRTVNLLLKYGITDIAVTAMYMAESVRDCLEKYFPENRFAFFYEKTPLGTAGSVGAARNFFDGDFIVISGDCVCDLDISEAINFHKEKNGIATVILAKRDDPTEYGEVFTDSNGRITEFKEKPDWSNVFTSDVNSGIYIFKKEIFDYIPDGKFDFSKDLFPLLLKNNVPIYARKTDFYWEDIGNAERFLAANSHVISKEGSDDFSEFPNAKIISPCVIGKGCKIGFATVGPNVSVGDGCVICDGAKIENSVLFDKVTVGSGTAVRGAALCENVRVAENCSIGEESVVGRNCRILKNSIVAAGSVLPSDGNFAENSRIYRGKFGTVGVLPIVRGEVFLGASLEDALRFGRAYGSAVEGNIAFALPKKAYSAVAQTLTSGIRDCGSNVYLIAGADLSALKYIVGNFGFQGGIYLKDGSAVLVDEDGLLISSEKARAVRSGLLSGDFQTGQGGRLKVFDGFMTAYGHHLSYIFEKSGVSLSDFPVFEIGKERFEISDGELRVFVNGSEVDGAKIRLACLYVFGKRRKKVFIPDNFYDVAEKIAEENAFGVRRISFTSPDRYLLFNFTDPVFCAAEIFAYMTENEKTFSDILSSLPSVSFSSERFEIVGSKTDAVLSLMNIRGAERKRGAVKIGKVSVYPTSAVKGFKVVAEAASAETSRALCEFYVNKIKNGDEKVKNDTSE